MPVRHKTIDMNVCNICCTKGENIQFERTTSIVCRDKVRHKTIFNVVSWYLTYLGIAVSRINIIIDIRLLSIPCGGLPNTLVGPVKEVASIILNLHYNGSSDVIILLLFTCCRTVANHILLHHRKMIPKSQDSKKLTCLG